MCLLVVVVESERARIGLSCLSTGLSKEIYTPSRIFESIVN